MSTENTKLRRHLRKQHPEEYNRAIEAQSNDTRDATIPPFTEEGFLEHLARFVVASGQVWFTDFGLLHALTHLQVG